jgi:hypothetical protein
MATPSLVTSRRRPGSVPFGFERLLLAEGGSASVHMNMIFDLPFPGLKAFAGDFREEGSPPYLS